jgi:hypothetical protein
MLSRAGFVGRRGPATRQNAGVFIIPEGSTTLPSFVTLTRASTGTYTNSTGIIATAAVNEARYDFDPVTLRLRGLLVEGQRTNLLLDSVNLSTQSITVTAVAHTLSFYGTGSVTLSGAATGTLNGTGAYPNLVQLTFTPSAGTLTLTVTGSVQFANCGIGAFASSWMPTTTAAATRAADNTVVNTLSAIGFNPLEGTIIATIQLNALVTAQRIFGLGNTGTSASRIELTTSGSNFRLFASDASVTQVDITAAGAAANTLIKVGIRYKLNDYGLCVNGGAVLTDTLASVPSVSSLFAGVDTLGGNQMFGTTALLTYIPVALGDAQLQARLV